MFPNNRKIGWFLIVAVTCLSGWGSTIASAQQGAGASSAATGGGMSAPEGALPVEGLLKAPELGDTSLSPDGRFFVYTVCDIEQQNVLRKPPHENYTETGVDVWKVGCALWVADTRSGEPRQLTGKENAWAPNWSPDGRRLAFYSDRDGVARLWTWEPGDGSGAGQFRRVSEEIVHAGGAPVWTPDSARLVVPLVPESLGLAAVTTSRGKAQDLSKVWKYEGATVRIFHANAPGSTQAATGLTPKLREGRDVEGDFDLAYVDVATGRAKRVGYVPGVGDYKVSPDGRQIALKVDVGSTSNSWNNMHRLDLIAEDGTRKTILSDQVNLDTVTWSPDGRYIAATATRYEGDVPHLKVHFIRLKDGQHTESADQAQVGYVSGGNAAWEPNGEYFDFLATHETPPAHYKTPFERMRAVDGTFKVFPIDPYQSPGCGFIRRKDSGVPWSQG
jgi:dipeptidyl aminopeptidase/acylaminoacyl peptidase